MRIKKEKNLIVARLETGENYLNSLLKIAQKEKISSGIILNSIGMLKNVELAYFQGKGKYKRNRFKDPMEVTATQGNIGKTENGKYKLHVHTTLADESGYAYAGHLEKGTVWVTAEILILKLDKVKFIRKLENETGLYGLNLE